MNPKASIVIPIYNEINLIEKFINKLYSTFATLEVKFIFIDDGSNDGSKEWLLENIPIIFIITYCLKILFCQRLFYKSMLNSIYFLIII